MERTSKPIQVQVLVNKKELTMEVDTGAAVSIISNSTRKALFPNFQLHESNLVLKTYTEEPMKIIDNLHVDVQYGSQQAKLVLVVVGGSGPSLFGRNWLKYIRLDWNSVAAIRSVALKPLHVLMERHKQLFSEGLGRVEPYKASLLIQPDATPIF